jgi:hypothetical protein
MTPPQQAQQEYIITKEKLDRAFQLLSTRMSSEQYYGVCNCLQSARPHTPAPESEKDGCAFRAAKLEAMYDNGYAEGATQARDQTIIQLQEKMCDLVDSGMKTPLATFDAAVFELRKEHRAPPPKEQEQR